MVSVSKIHSMLAPSPRPTDWRAQMRQKMMQPTMLWVGLSESLTHGYCCPALMAVAGHAGLEGPKITEKTSKPVSSRS